MADHAATSEHCGNPPKQPAVKYYRLCGQVLESEMTFPELPAATAKASAWRFRVRHCPHSANRPFEWYHEWTSDHGESWLQFARSGNSYLLRFPGMADFFVDANSDVSCHAAANIPRRTLRHLFLDQVFPLLLDRGGATVLHASAVEWRHGIVAFLGETGAGKSTLAANFAFAGFPLVTDDFLVVNSDGKPVTGIPSYPAIRLWDDAVTTVFGHASPVTQVAHYSNKKRIIMGSHGVTFAQEPLPIRRIYVLSSEETSGAARGSPVISRLDGSAAFMALFVHSFHMDVHQRRGLRANFHGLSKIAALPLVYSLKHSRGLTDLPVIRAAVIEDLDKAG